MYLYLDNAESTAASPRSVAGGELIIQSVGASKFGTPTVDVPLRLAVFDPETDGLKTVLLVTARTSNVLTVDGTTAGYADSAVATGDVVACVPLGADLTELWAAIPDVGDFVTSEALDEAVADKQDVLPTSGDPSKVLNGELEWVDSPTPDLSDYATLGVTDALDARLDTAESDINALEAASSTFALAASTYTKSQVDTALTGRELTIATGTTAQYVAGNKSLRTFTTDVLAALPATTITGLVTAGANIIRSGSGTPGDPYVLSSTLPANLNWDATNKRLGVNATSPAASLVVQQNSSENLQEWKNSSGTTLSQVGANGELALQFLTFGLASGVDLTAVTTKHITCEYAGTIARVRVSIGTNGSTGGFTLDVTKNGTSIFSAPQTIANSTTADQLFTAFSTTSVADGDQFRVVISSPGTFIQDVRVKVVVRGRNA